MQVPLEGAQEHLFHVPDVAALERAPREPNELLHSGGGGLGGEYGVSMHTRSRRGHMTGARDGARIRASAWSLTHLTPLPSNILLAKNKHPMLASWNTLFPTLLPPKYRSK